MSISLMSDIEDKLVLRGIIYIMKSYNKFDGSQTGAEMTRIHRTALYHISTDLFTENSQLGDIHSLDILRGVHLVKQSICLIILIHMAFKSV
jgi:hypothetical protein